MRPDPRSCLLALGLVVACASGGASRDPAPPPVDEVKDGATAAAPGDARGSGGAPADARPGEASRDAAPGRGADATAAAMPGRDGAADAAASAGPPPGDAAAAPGTGVPVVYVGSGFNSKPSAVYTFRFDPATGALAQQGAPLPADQSPTFLVPDRARRFLYATIENMPGQVAAYAIAPGSGALTRVAQVPAGGTVSTNLDLDATGRYLFEAHWGSGTVTVLPVRPDGTLGAVVETRSLGPGARAHCVRPDPTNRFVFAASWQHDAIVSFAFDAATGKLAPTAPPTVPSATGAGPRILQFHPGGRFAYVINQRNSTLSAYTYDPTTGALVRIQDLPALPPGMTGNCSHLEVAPSGRFVYGSAGDQIVVFAVDAGTGKLTSAGTFPTRGRDPRHFSIDETGRFLFAANMSSSTVAVFRIDENTGALEPVGQPTPATRPSWVGLVYVPAK